MKNYFKYFLCIFMFSTPAYADDYSDKVKEILRLSNAIQPGIDMADSMLGNLSTQSIDQIFQGLKDQGKDVVRDDVVELYNDYRTEFIAALGENMVDLLIEPYRKSFTLEELDELIVLMQSSTYQKYSIRMPELMASSQKAGELFGAQKGQEIMMRLISENPKFR
jgi:hypothetical protein